MRRAMRRNTKLNVSLNGTCWTTPAEYGPGTDEHTFLDVHQPHLIDGVHANVKDISRNYRVLATSDYWGSKEKPETPVTQVSLMLQEKNLSFDHLELPIYQFPRVILDGASVISEALAAEALSPETSDLIRYTTRRAIIAASTAAFGQVLRPFKTTIEKLKLSLDNPYLGQCRGALQELNRWHTLTEKHRRKVKFGICTTIRDAPLILKGSQLLKRQEVSENTVWWSGYNAMAWRKISNHQSKRGSKLSETVRKLKKKIARLEERNRILNDFVYAKGEAVEECGIPFPDLPDEFEDHQLIPSKVFHLAITNPLFPPPFISLHLNPL